MRTLRVALSSQIHAPRLTTHARAMPAPPSLPSLSLAAQATTYLVGDHARGVATATADPDTAVGVGDPASAFALASSLTIAYSSACASSRTDLHGAACRGRRAVRELRDNCAQNCARIARLLHSVEHDRDRVDARRPPVARRLRVFGRLQVGRDLGRQVRAFEDRADAGGGDRTEVLQRGRQRW